MTRPQNSRKPWQSDNAGCTLKNFNGLMFDILKLVHFHLLWAIFRLAFFRNYIFLFSIFIPLNFIANPALRIRALSSDLLSVVTQRDILHVVHYMMFKTIQTDSEDLSNSQNHQIHQSHQIHQILVIDCRMSTVYRGLVLSSIVL